MDSVADATTTPKTGRLKIEYVPIDQLVPQPRNARKHPPEQIRQLEASIREFSFTNPILADEDLQVLAGHARLEAARRRGLSTVPVVRLVHLTEVQKRAYAIADNKLGEAATWNEELLKIELEALQLEKFDIELTGFVGPELDTVLYNEAGASDPADEVPAPTVGPAVTRLGDLWRLGRHRLICGDSTLPETYQALLGDRQAQMIFNDPPYNVPIEGHVSGLGQHRHREFSMAAGEMSEEAFTAFLAKAMGLMAQHSAEGSLHMTCMDWRHLYELLTAGRGVFAELKNIVVWNKTNGGMGSLYRSKHELITVWKHGQAPHINNVQLGVYGRGRTNVWDYAGANAFGADRDETLAMHPTVKPIGLVADAILDCSHKGGLVCDNFAGVGTTLLAAEKTGRDGYAIELDPAYCDIALERYRKMTGDVPVLDATGETREVVAAKRHSRKEHANDDR